uniref:Retrotransposon gag domain-containing protein n=1 Tax=Lygus hesperus TaxID=30085 RepID=A0A146L8C3_LYGHE
MSVSVANNLPWDILPFPMAPYVGQLHTFSSTKNEWKIAKPRMISFFTANNITDATIKQALFLNSLDESSYRLMHNLCVPDEPETKSYDALVKFFDDHFIPAESIFALRHRFFNAGREKGETLCDWLARVRSLGGPCKFTDLDQQVIDRFVLGLPKGPVKDRLFEEDRLKLSMEKAMNVATAKESASHQYDLTSTQTPGDVKQEPVFRTTFRRGRGKSTADSRGQRKGTSSSGAQTPCGVCGRSHPAPCWYKNVSCNLCKGNHLAKGEQRCFLNEIFYSIFHIFQFN